MSNWIKVRSNLRTSPKVVIVASQLSVTPITALGAICTAWMLADEHANEHGLLKDIDLNALDAMIGIGGLGDAMAKVGWVKETSKGVQFVNYEKHNGSTAKSRAREQQRKQVSRSCPKKTGQKPDKTRTREEKNREREDNIEDTNTVQSDCSEPPKVTWLAEKGWENITEEDHEAWEEAYPAVAIKQELEKANQWLLSNPKKAKKRLWRRFITTWLNSVQQRGGTRGYIPSIQPGSKEPQLKALN